jgi:hypothetical protein
MHALLQRAATVPLLLAILISCGDATGPDGGNGGGPPALTVLSVTPAAGATNVDRTSTVTATFSQPLDAASVTSSSFSVGSGTGTIEVEGSVATYTPSEPYPAGATVSVSISGIRSADGATMASPFTSSFTTRDPVPLAADAGADREASFGETVTLDPSASSGEDPSFSWTQVSGPAVGSLSGGSPSFEAPDQVVWLEFELAVSADGETARDTVAVLVLEDREHAFFVSPDGSDSNPGTRTAPFATIQAAIETADAQGNGGDVYVAAGSYDESLVLRSRVSVYGGFDPGTWQRDVSALRPVVRGGPMAVRATQANNLTLEGVEIVAADAGQAGESSIAVFLHDSRGVAIRNNRLVAGLGFRGAQLPRRPLPQRHVPARPAQERPDRAAPSG